MNKTNDAGVIALLIYGAIIVAFGWGWGLNIIALAGSTSTEATGILILRGFGIVVPPLGAVMGWFI